MKAVQLNNLVDVVHLLAHGSNINWQDPVTKISFIHCSIQQGYVGLSDLLLQNGANINLQDHKKWAPLHHAVFLNKIHCVILLIRRSASLNIINDEHQVSNGIYIYIHRQMVLMILYYRHL